MQVNTSKPDFLPFQKKYGKKLIKKLKKLGYAYLVAPPRAGKTMTALYATEHIKEVQKILIVTKKNAFNGWEKFTKHLTKEYVIINKESIHKINPKDFSMVILDEAHTIGGVGRVTSTHKKMQSVIKDLPQLLISATPFVETHNSVYYQMTKSKYNPFREFKNFYDFFREYGKPNPIRIGKDREVETYKLSQPKLIKKVAKFTVTMPKLFDVNAVDKVHYLELTKKQKKFYNTIVNDEYLKVKKHEFTADTKLKMRLLLHQIEGGVIKDDEEQLFFIGSAKIDYIKKYLLKGKVGIMTHFRGEQELLKKEFPSAEIYSSNAHAEGVDLSHLDTFIIYSQDYSGTKHIQRKDRLVNMNGSKSLTVHHLLGKGAISEQVYKTCSKKEDFNNSTFKKLTL